MADFFSTIGQGIKNIQSGITLSNPLEIFTAPITGQATFNTPQGQQSVTLTGEQRLNSGILAVGTAAAAGATGVLGVGALTGGAAGTSISGALSAGASSISQAGTWFAGTTAGKLALGLGAIGLLGGYAGGGLAGLGAGAGSALANTAQGAASFIYYPMTAFEGYNPWLQASPTYNPNTGQTTVGTPSNQAQNTGAVGGATPAGGGLSGLATGLESFIPIILVIGGVIVVYFVAKNYKGGKKK